MRTKLGYLQAQMLSFAEAHPGRHSISPDYETVRVARSLERRGLIHITDCGMCSASGRPVLMISATADAP